MTIGSAAVFGAAVLIGTAMAAHAQPAPYPPYAHYPPVAAPPYAYYHAPTVPPSWSYDPYTSGLSACLNWTPGDSQCRDRVPSFGQPSYQSVR